VSSSVVHLNDDFLDRVVLAHNLLDGRYNVESQSIEKNSLRHLDGLVTISVLRAPNRSLFLLDRLHHGEEKDTTTEVTFSMIEVTRSSYSHQEHD